MGHYLLNIQYKLECLMTNCGLTSFLTDIVILSNGWIQTYLRYTRQTGAESISNLTVDYSCRHPAQKNEQLVLYAQEV